MPLYEVLVRDSDGRHHTVTVEAAGERMARLKAVAKAGDLWVKPILSVTVTEVRD